MRSTALALAALRESRNRRVREARLERAVRRLPAASRSALQALLTAQRTAELQEVARYR